MSEFTRILNAAQGGDAKAQDDLLPLVYNELRQLAALKMAHESGTQTLQPTGLVHEAWLRLGGDEQSTWENRNHFFCAAAEVAEVLDILRPHRRQLLGPRSRLPFSQT